MGKLLNSILRMVREVGLEPTCTKLAYVAYLIYAPLIRRLAYPRL